MSQSDKWIKESLDREVFQQNPFNDWSKQKILQQLEKRQRNPYRNPFQKLVPIVLTVVVAISGVLAMGSFTYKKNDRAI